MSPFPYGIRPTTLPEGAPPDVALAEVLVVGRLLDQPVDLLGDVECLLAREVPASQLVPHALDDVQRLPVERLRLWEVMVVGHFQIIILDEIYQTS